MSCLEQVRGHHQELSHRTEHLVQQVRLDELVEEVFVGSVTFPEDEVFLEVIVRKRLQQPKSEGWLSQ
jgi:hypothetical protein